MVPEWVRRIVATPSGGYTITELTVVVAVLGVLSAVTLPSLWTYLRTATLRAGAEETISVLNGARQLAIRLNTTVCVTNDGIRAQYRVGSCSAAAWTGTGTDANGHIRLANHLSVSGANNLCFNSLGAGSATPSPCAANGTLTVTAPSGAATLNVVMATTGRLRVQ
jgi:prepilin-type N-terminal cleavage/methylation domain-containing protein